MNEEARAELDRLEKLHAFELTEPDKAFVRARREYLSPAAAAEFAEVLAEPVASVDEKGDSDGGTPSGEVTEKPKPVKKSRFRKPKSE